MMTVTPTNKMSLVYVFLLEFMKYTELFIYSFRFRSSAAIFVSRCFPWLLI